MKHFLCVPCDHLADRGYNKAIHVYRIKRNKLHLIGGNYRIDSASWRGYKSDAIRVVTELLGHKNDGYEFTAKNVNMQVA